MRSGPLLAQTRVELTLTARRGESVLLTIGIPVLLLAFFGATDVLPKPDGFTDAVDFLAPGILALAVMSTAMVGLGIATGFERQYGVLKRLGATPLGRPALLSAKTISVLAVEAVQAVLLGGLAVAMGWRPDVAGIVMALAAVIVGTVAFAGIGLLMAGTLRGEVNLAAANGLYLVLLLLGGMVIPLDQLGVVRHLAEALPSAALAELLRGSLTSGTSPAGWAWPVLLAWAVVAPFLAARTFRWE